ncbi:hypothetical protein ACJJTC_013132 [Scirpophaga incertulas]
MEIVKPPTANLEDAPEQRKIALFLNAAGEEAVEVYNTFNKKFERLEDVVTEFKSYSQPRKGTLINTYQFLNIRQNEGEPLEHFITRVKIMGKKCALGELEERLITMMLIVGINDHNLKEALLRVDEIGLVEAVTMCRAAAEGKRQIMKLNNNIIEVDALTTKKKYEKVRMINSCLRCGRTHPINNCPAYGKVCAVCKKYNHFAKQCSTKINKGQHIKRETVHMVENHGDECEEFKLDSVSYIHYIDKLKWTENIVVNNVEIDCKLDTGADCNTLPLTIFNKINNKCQFKLEKCHKILVVYNGQKIYPQGCIVLHCLVRGRMHNIKFTVIDIKAPPVLGLTECVKLKLIRKIDVVECVATTEKEKFIQNNKDVFTGLGVLGTYQIQVSNEAQPVVKPIRRIPVMVKDKLIKTLNAYDKMLNNKQQTKVNYDKTAIKRKSYKIGESVRLQNRPDKLWYPGKIIRHAGTRSYIVKTEKGNEVRRNEKHLIHSRNHFIVKPRQEEYRSSRQQSDLEHKIVRDYSDCNENVISRSGRIIKKPIRYKDYVS